MKSKVALKDAPVLKAMHELAAQYPRYGYRRIQVFLERQGQIISADRVHRIWRDWLLDSAFSRVWIVEWRFKRIYRRFDRPQLIRSS